MMPNISRFIASRRMAHRVIIHSFEEGTGFKVMNVIMTNEDTSGVNRRRSADLSYTNKNRSSLLKIARMVLFVI